MNVIEKVRLKLRELGYIAEASIAAQIALMLAARGEWGISAMLLDGPSGTGKSALPRAVAKAIGANFMYIQCHQGSNPEQFLFDANIVQILRAAAGDKGAVSSAADVVKLGFLPRLFEESQKGLVVGMVDELDKAAEALDALFLAALQEREVVVDDRVIKANPHNVLLFITKNDRRRVSGALMRRLRRHYFTFLPEEYEVLILSGGVRPTEKPGPVLEIPRSPYLQAPEPLSQALVRFAWAVRRKPELFLTLPTVQEIQIAASDILMLRDWRRMDLAAEMLDLWLGGESEDIRNIRQALPAPQYPQTLFQSVVASSSPEQVNTLLVDEAIRQLKEVTVVRRLQNSNLQLSWEAELQALGGVNRLDRFFSNLRNGSRSTLEVERTGLGKVQADVRLVAAQQGQQLNRFQFTIEHVTPEMLKAGIEALFQLLAQKGTDETERNAEIRALAFRDLRHQIEEKIDA